MSFDWTEYLALADSLHLDPQIPGPEEACLRSAVSRSYYAVFGTMLEYAKSTTGYIKRYGGSDHTQLPRHLQACDDPLERQIGIDLDNLRVNRRLADYDDTLPQTAEDLARVSLLTAHEIMEYLSTLTGAS